MPEKPKMSSSELGALWMTYHKKSMILLILEYFIEKSDDQKAKDLMSELRDQLHPKIIEMKTMFENEGAVIPEGFTKRDVNLDAPNLWDNGFDIMFCRILKQISMGMYVLHLTMSYRQDIIKLYRDITEITEIFYGRFTQYLLEENLFTRPPYVNMPETIDYITDIDYTKGSNILGEKRALNTVEFGYMYHTIETNITGMQLLAGFIQTTKDKDVKKYFSKGKELSKEIISETSSILLENNIQPPTTPGGTVTSSTIAPFSDKLMMFCNYLLGGLSLGSGGFSAGFSLRNDLQTHNAIVAKDLFQYQRNGVILMMSKGWLEEPPKMDL
ncbi:DUF3231 family protein [Lederbergia lenta]|uniref:Protein of uncharacterized function (DUF3231) n=1 Tax=Lederbergia lenta TaxID=1467 RepID=A0A2X4WM84_LEDLE|nr:DUF3231 family protein [Lederbergia lenta]MCM3109785.1 DUF3231 family protein [Lederbergia lenta]MEC2324465.1 DUF3231 family protein [Lederbergia lenta]SQI59812.1 Protein of uncharacterised function (DUF3231) [Lederbergia lenta]